MSATRWHDFLINLVAVGGLVVGVVVIVATAVYQHRVTTAQAAKDGGP